MPRTYLKSRDNVRSQEPAVRHKLNLHGKTSTELVGGKKKKSGKENKLFSDSSDDEPESSVEEIKPKRGAVKLNPSYSPDNSDSLLRDHLDDTFDKLFGKVDEKKLEKIRKPSIPVVDYSSEMSPSVDSNDSANCWGLFKSFSEKEEVNDDKCTLKKKSAVSKGSALLAVNPVPEVIDYPSIKTACGQQHATSSLSTLANESNRDTALGMLLSPSMGGSSCATAPDDSIKSNFAINAVKKSILSPTTFFSQTPGATKRGKTVSCLTSTPVLSVSRMSSSTTAPPAPTPRVPTCNPITEQEDDNVFLDEGVEQPCNKQPLVSRGDVGNGLDVPPTNRLEALSSGDVFPQTPQSFVNPVRGKKNYGGPALSVMQHYNFKPTMISPMMNLSDKSTKVVWSPSVAHLQASHLSSGSNISSGKKTNKYNSNSIASTKSDVSKSSSVASVEHKSSHNDVSSEQQSVYSTSDTKLSTDHEGYERVDNTCTDTCTQQREDAEAGEEMEEEEGTEEQEHVDEYSLGCECGNMALEDWIIQCDGCLLYFHASCIGMADSYVEILAGPEPPEWFCVACSTRQEELGLVGDVSITSHSFRSGIGDTETFDTDIDLASGLEEFLPEVSAKPGKRWRKSIASGLLAKGFDVTSNNIANISVGIEKTSFNDFAVPLLPPAAATIKAPQPNDRRITRRSTRLSKLPVGDHLEHLKNENTKLAVPVSDDNTNLTCAAPPMRRTRPSFYVVPRGGGQYEEASFSQTAHDMKRLSCRPSFYITTQQANISKDHCEVSVEKSILVDEDISDLDKLLHQCTDKAVTDFSSIYGADALANSKKVGEGAFGEVFLVGTSDGERPVLKVVPIGGDVKVNEEEQTTFRDMMSEVVISRSLSNLRNGDANFTSGFVEVRNCIVFQGKYPTRLLELWDAFDQERESENDRPDFLPTDQLFIALEFNNGGQDLEKYVFRNACQALAAWRQVVHTLAVAEAQLEFEHRDLHWGNILIKPTTDKTVNFTVNNKTYCVETDGVKTTIIDFSLSRLTSEAVDGCTIFNNLAEDPTLFKGRGDIQFDVYRTMKNENGNSWEKFTPKTNVFWLDYLLAKMTSEVHYKAKKGKATPKAHKTGLANMNNIRKNLMEFSSALDWVLQEGIPSS